MSSLTLGLTLGFCGMLLWREAIGRSGSSKLVYEAVQDTEDEESVRSGASIDEADALLMQLDREDESINTLDPQDPKSRVRSSLAAAAIMASVCREGDSVLLSGAPGERMCDEQYPDAWPAIDVCGSGPRDTYWSVKRGDQGDWDLAVDCKRVPECSGKNAICDSSGCRFVEQCQ